MKRRFLFMACAILFGGIVLAVSCDDESDRDKGKADGKALCDCYKSLGDNPSDGEEEACESKLNQSKLGDPEDITNMTDYAKGVMEGYLAGGCLELGE